MVSKKGPATAPGGVSKVEKDADLVMATNNSSIASKRSVEQLYYPKPHFFRHFVAKPQRRSPVINRGYWLRMHTMEESVRRFMREPSKKPKFVLNLGCGFDPLPFILLSADESLCRNTTFVDIDYEKLMVNRKLSIQKSDDITQLLQEVEVLPNDSPIQVRSKNYVAVGCDLKNLEKLDEVLRRQILPSECSVLFLAEVSLTYMDVKSATAVLQWAAKLSNDAQFCILEQHFPDGPEHPFASAMMKHFKKMGAPLHSIHEYPSLRQQEKRFTDAGWSRAKARSLWDLWSDDEFVGTSLRNSLDAVEPFDEWEEFALFASHYFLLHASTSPGSETLLESTIPEASGDSSGEFSLLAKCPSVGGQRRFGALIPDGNTSIGYHSGIGRQTRLLSTDLYTESKDIVESQLPFPPNDISARMCHTVTDLGNGDCLLVGGRASPASGFRDCWLREAGQWRQTQSLPAPRFRHNAVKVTLDTDHVLVYGGKDSSGCVLNTWLSWSKSGNGWREVDINRDNVGPRFGACSMNLDDTSGVLFGGIGPDGVVLDDFWTWKCQQKSDGSLFLELTDQTENLRNNSPLFKYINRFGATVNRTSWGLVIVGGVTARRVVPLDKEIMFLDLSILLKCLKGEISWTDSPNIVSAIGLGAGFEGPRPLLVGHAASTVTPDELVILGGGAVCFAFGTVWTEGTWMLKRKDSTAENNWALVSQS
ncbi:leucine carboxyl methyltransferase [Aspergillus taichungensis]|uniref:tRNA wybutosine-synthesizing protein 4 n=1 Tax=Aspergillus taichungensis TaxID=482145 RepID=A0A2J5HPJ8_9EURO|nr:leucine carboxyl methyltransferase [Aspergillus taichungensis]